MPRVWIPRAGDALLLDAPWTVLIAASYGTKQLFPKLSDRELDYEERPITFDAGDALVFSKIGESSSRYPDAAVTLIVKSCGDSSRAGASFSVKSSAMREISGALESSSNPTSNAAHYRALAAGRKPKPASKKLSLRRAQRAVCDACAGSHAGTAIEISKWIATELEARGHMVGYGGTAIKHRDVLSELRRDSQRYWDKVSAWHVTSEEKLGNSIVREFRACLKQWVPSLSSLDAPIGLRVTSARDGSVTSVEKLV